MRPEAELDLECFRNWFLVGITDLANGWHWDFEQTDTQRLDIESIVKLLRHYTVVTFNGNKYDIPMLVYALTGATCEQLKIANDDIIGNNLQPWAFYKKYDLHVPDYIDTYDVSEVAPGVRVSLKQYGCRMHSKTVQDTPVDFNAPLPLEHAPEEIAYCRNDRLTTADIRILCAKRLDLRRRMSERYGVDLRSKSDAQMAEAMLKAAWSKRMTESVRLMERLLGNQDALDLAKVEGSLPHLSLPAYKTNGYTGQIQPEIPHYPHGTTFKVRLPDYIHFVTPQMQEFLQIVRDCDFLISNKDEAEMMGFDGTSIKTGVMIPDVLKGRDIVIGRSTYRVGIGGLHSSEQGASHRSIPGVLTLETADVGSYYPSMIINSGMYPPQLGPLFQELYRTIYKDRIAAKKKLKTLSEDSPEYGETAAIEGGFKIVLNGTFGKLWSRFSIFYAPEMGVAVTIGGQLSLLMLIERLELSGIRVVSANTDGIEMSIPWGYELIADQILTWWQKLTNLSLDRKTYLALYSRDVNNYISLQFDGSTKRKGIFGKSGLLENKHPDLDICADAVEAFLLAGTPLGQTIRSCTDIRKFIRVRGAKGGAMLFQPGVDNFIYTSYCDDKGKVKQKVSGVNGGTYLGRAVRWYYAKDCQDYIIDSKSFNKVAGSDGCRPVMTLPETMPTDVDFSYYEKIAEELLEAVGYGKENL